MSHCNTHILTLHPHLYIYYYIYIYIIFLNKYLLIENRARLRGMSIEGISHNGMAGFAITNYDSGGPPCSNDNARLNGTSVCDDVILIPVNSGTEVQFVQISKRSNYENFLTLCEVQVFAAKLNNRTRTIR